MQHILVIVVVAVAAFFLGRRLWRSWRHPGTTSCGCGCSGCETVAGCPATKKTLPSFKP